MQAMASEAASKFRQRLGQLGAAFTATRKADPKFLPLLLAVGLGTLLPVLAGGVLLGRPLIGALFAVLLAVLAGMIVFGRRVQRVQFDAIEGQPGAAAAVLQAMRGGWRVTPAVAFTRKQDFVHVAVGRPGVVLVGEGTPARVSSLLKQERRRVSRAVGDTPVHDVSVGTRDGQVPLPRLQTHLAKLPRALKRGEVDELDKRLAALHDQGMPIPKGPLPRNLRGKMR